MLNDGVELGDECLVAAGSTITENKSFPRRSLIRGVPGKTLGTIKERHAELQRRAAESYVRRIDRYRAEGTFE